MNQVKAFDAQFSNLFQRFENHWLLPLTHIAGILPLLTIVLPLTLSVLGITPMGDIEDIAEELGSLTNWFFVAMLACTPIYILTGWRKPLTLKKALGLYAFMYAAIHMLGFFVAYDMTTHSFAIESLTSVTLLSGWVGLLITLPLAITSNKWSMKRLGKRWKKLHQWTYVAAIAIALHLLIVGDGVGVVYLLLLVVRIPNIKKSLVKWRKQLVKDLRVARAQAA